MKISQGYQEKSRLGRLLVNRGYVTESQLDDALEQQRASGALLGEVMVSSGWITERDLGRVLRHQTRYRNAAALVAMVTLPLQPLVTFAAAAPERAEGATTATRSHTGFAPLTEYELGQVTGQGVDGLLARIEEVSQMPGKAASGNEAAVDVVESLKLAANTFVPILNFLESDLTITGVHYRINTPRLEILADGGLKLAMPERIELVEMNAIRVSGSQGPSMGNVSLHNIRFSPESHMIIHSH